MDTKKIKPVKKQPKPNLNGPNSPVPKRKVGGRDLKEKDQDQVTRLDDEEEDHQKEHDLTVSLEEGDDDQTQRSDQEREEQEERIQRAEEALRDDPSY